MNDAGASLFGPLGALIAELAPLAPLVVLVSLRVGVVFAALPAPFGTGAPTVVRVGLGVLVATALVAPHRELAEGLSLEPVALLRAAVLEVAVGTVMGLTVRVILAAVEAAGAMIDLSGGLGFAGTVDPNMGESAGPLGALLSSLAVLFFFAFGGHHVVLAALAASLRAAPPGGTLDAIALHGATTIGSDLVARGLRMAAPVVATMFLVQVGLALVSRAAPKVHLFAFSFSIAISTAVLVLFVAAPSVATAIAAELQRLPDALESLF